MGKTILVTGSTDGIGEILVRNLAQSGYKVILHGRNEEKLKELSNRLKSEFDDSNIEYFRADLSDLNQVKLMAEKILEKISALDVIVNNAGVFNSPVTKTKEGFDIRFMVNFLAPVLLTQCLLPLIEKSEEARIINLSSAAQRTVDLNALNSWVNLSEREAYAQSKLAITMWSFHLAQKKKNICVIPVNPGSLLNTKMVKEAFGHFWSKAEKGSDILFELATSKGHLKHSGEYFDNDKEAYSKAHSDAYDENKINALIAQTSEILKKHGPA